MKKKNHIRLLLLHRTAGGYLLVIVEYGNSYMNRVRQTNKKIILPEASR